MTTLSEGVDGLVFSSSDFSLFCLLLSALGWVFVHQRFSQSLPYYFLPTAAWQAHERKIKLYLKQGNDKSEKNGNPLDIAAEMFPIGDGLPPTGPGAKMAAAAESVAQTPKDLRTYYVTSRANATAFLHSVLVCPMALAVVMVTISKANEELGAPLWATLGIGVEDKGLFETVKSYLWDWGETDAFFNNRSFLLDIIAYTMAGYFLWDLFECIKNRDVHSRAFVLHGLLSLYAMVAYLLTSKGKMTGISAFMCLSEISTPIVHLRWFLIQTKQTDTLLFRISNVAAAFLFILYRLGIVPLLVLPHLALDLLRGCRYTASAPLFRRVSFSISCCLWVCLNAYWAGLFLRSHLKHREKTGVSKEHKP